jgi:hypothetical protein
MLRQLLSPPRHPPGPSHPPPANPAKVYSWGSDKVILRCQLKNFIVWECKTFKIYSGDEDLKGQYIGNRATQKKKTTHIIWKEADFKAYYCKIYD